MKDKVASIEHLVVESYGKVLAKSDLFGIAFLNHYLNLI
jgi:hypothetical protein